MTQILTHCLISALPLAEESTKIFDEVGIGSAIVLTVTGMAMHWQLPRHRMSMEERVKDGKITDDEARRQIRFRERCAPIATVIGVGVLLVVLFDLSK